MEADALTELAQSLGPVGTLVVAYFANEWRKGKAAEPKESETAKAIREMHADQKLHYVKQEACFEAIEAQFQTIHKDHDRLMESHGELRTALLMRPRLAADGGNGI